MIKGAKELETAVLAMNIQLFADESVEPEVAEPETEDNDTEDLPFSDEEEELEDDDDWFWTDTEVETETDEEEPEPEEEKSPVQTKEANAAFAELRRKAEEAEKKAKMADKIIADQYGESHGIYTVEQYQAALEKQAEEEKRQNLIEKGIDPEDLDEIINNHPAIQAAKKAEQDRLLLDSYRELQGEYPQLINQPQDIDAETWARWDNGTKGLTLLEAYTLVHRKDIQALSSKAAARKAVNTIKSKQHISADLGHSAEPENIVIPPDVLEAYKAMFPGRSMKDFHNDYKRYNKGVKR